MNETFWAKLNELVATSIIVIDRPKGSSHPRYPEAIYPLDYGYLEDTSSGDGDGIDVWMGSASGTSQISGAMVTADTVKRDVEIKVLLNCTDENIETILHFTVDESMGCQLIRPVPQQEL